MYTPYKNGLLAIIHISYVLFRRSNTKKHSKQTLTVCFHAKILVKTFFSPPQRVARCFLSF